MAASGLTPVPPPGAPPPSGVASPRTGGGLGVAAARSAIMSSGSNGNKNAAAGGKDWARSANSHTARNSQAATMYAEDRNTSIDAYTARLRQITREVDIAEGIISRYEQQQQQQQSPASVGQRDANSKSALTPIKLGAAAASSASRGEPPRLTSPIVRGPPPESRFDPPVLSTTVTSLNPREAEMTEEEERSMRKVARQSPRTSPARKREGNDD